MKMNLVLGMVCIAVLLLTDAFGQLATDVETHPGSVSVEEEDSAASVPRIHQKREAETVLPADSKAFIVSEKLSQDVNADEADFDVVLREEAFITPEEKAVVITDMAGIAVFPVPDAGALRDYLESFEYTPCYDDYFPNYQITFEDGIRFWFMLNHRRIFSDRAQGVDVKLSDDEFRIFLELLGIPEWVDENSGSAHIWSGYEQVLKWVSGEEDVPEWIRQAEEEEKILKEQLKQQPGTAEEG